MFVVAGVLDQVPHDQEVGREPHVGDDAELVVDPLTDLVGEHVAVAGVGALLVVSLRRYSSSRQARRAGEVRAAPPCRTRCRRWPARRSTACCRRPRDRPENSWPHLGRRLEVELLGVELEPVRVVAGRARLDAEQRVVGLGVVLVDVVAVVGGQQRGADPLGDLDQLGVRLVLLGEAVVLQLDEEVVPAEDVLEPGGGLDGAVEVALEEPLADEAAEAAAGGDQALPVLLEELEVEAGLVEEPVEVGGRRDLDEVLVALGRLRQQGQVEDLVFGPAGPVVPGAGDEVPLHADDRRDPGLLGRGVEVEDAVHVAVVGDADRRLAVGRPRRP